MSLTGFRDILNSDTIYAPNEILDVLKVVRPHFRFSYSNKKEKYFNVPCAFDIEASSFFRSTGNNEREKVGIMYVWSFGIMGAVVIGRTWNEFVNMVNTLSKVLALNENKRLIIYVHNLGYDFQFFRKWFEWVKVFSIENRRPLYALTNNGLEFRCSYLLSGYSLEAVGNDLREYSVRKLIGNLDYSLIRHSKTVLSGSEIEYCVNDVKVLMAYIAERIEQDGGIAKLPLTKTGYVRQYCRNSCFYEGGKKRKESFKRFRYMELMRGLKLTVREYDQLKRGLQGGFTHANAFYTNKVVTDVTSFDFTSSYPCVMVAEKFPMGPSELVTIKSEEDLEKNLKLYCCLFDIEINNLQSKLYHENYISVSRCRKVINANINNGRIVSADHLITTVTEQDFLIIRQFYTWPKGACKIYNFRRYRRGYLPTDFVKAILKLYADKTELKEVAGKEVEYAKAKEMINSCYGMIVTDILRDTIDYVENEWPKEGSRKDEEYKPLDKEMMIIKYNKNRSRFLFYPWGVWVLAYARRNLFAGILEFGSDYIYSDTDSIKARNVDNHMGFINDYNARIRKQLYKAMEYHGIPKEAIEPTTKDGVKKCLGVWDFDGHYSRFKTLGAKRYLVEYSNDPRNKTKNRGKIVLTVSGINKKKCVPWMLKTFGDKIFDAFDIDLCVPADYTGKATHTYIDDIREGVVTDYQGVTAPYMELSAIHHENAEYSLSLSQEYTDYFLGVQQRGY